MNEEENKDLSKQKSEIINKKENENLSIISDESLLNVYGEIMNNLRSDRNQVSELVDTFSNMVMNDGDSSTSSKEALVNLIKTKMDASDKMSKIADLMTRIKLKQPDTYQPWMGGKKEMTAGQMMQKDSTEVIHLAVQRMLPKNTLSRGSMRRLKVYAGAAHPHKAQIETVKI